MAFALAAISASPVGCSSDGDDQAAADSGALTLTRDVFLGLLTVEDVKQAQTADVQLTAQFFRDLRSMAESVDPGQVVSIESWYGNTFQTQDGRSSLTFTIMDFESGSSARDHFDKIRSGSPAPEPLDPPIGDLSVAVRDDVGGIGSTLVFRKGDKVVTLHTAYSEGERPPVSIQAVEELARFVAGKLR